MTEQLATHDRRPGILDRAMLHDLRGVIPADAYAGFLRKLDQLIVAYFDPAAADPRATPIDPIRLEAVRARALECSGGPAT